VTIKKNQNESNTSYSRRNVLSYGAGGLAVGLAGCAGNGGEISDGSSNSEIEDVRWRAGTPGEGSSTFAIANGLSRILDEQGSNIDLEVASYSGSNEAIRLVGRGEDELAGSALPLAAAANRNEEPVPDGPADFTGQNALEFKPVQALNFLDFRMYWITFEDNDIETVNDFEGRNIGVFQRGAAFNNLTLLSVTNMLDKVNEQYVEFNEIASALDTGRIDATGFYAGQGTVPAGWQTQLINDDRVQIVTWSEEQLEQIGDSGYATPAPVQVNDIFEKDLPMETVMGNAIPYGFFPRENLPEERMYQFTKTLLDNADQIAEFSASVEHFTAQYASESLSPGMPVHSGVARYLKEEDLWNDNLTEA
jgi:TRAP transporter TAXI family solute receptor